MLKEKYIEEVVPAFLQEDGYKNIYQVPKIEKITLNIGVGRAIENPRLLEVAVETLTTIAGQKPVVTRAKKAISNFKLRKGHAIGAMVTLRRQRMWDFLDRLVYIALPRVRDFRGLSPNSFDGRGNYNFGIKEQIIFPEIDYDKVDIILGMNITIVTTAKNDEEAYKLLDRLGFPFRKRNK